MYLKIHETREGKIVAVCDEDLLGKTFEEGKAFLDLKTYRNFYDGGKADEAKVKDALKSFSSANLVGKKSIGVARALGLIEDEDIKYIRGVPYSQIYNI